MRRANRLSWRLATLFVLFAASGAEAQEVPIVFVHGLASSGATWQGAAERLNARLAITPYRPDLNWRATVESQSGTLQGVVGWLPGSTIAVGHSNGGLVARQWSKSHPLHGVITVGTPHNGAPLAYNALAWLGFNQQVGSVITDVFNAFSRNCCDWYWVLGLVGDLTDWVRYWMGLQIGGLISTLGVEIGAPVLAQMSSSSPANLNSSGNLAREAAAIPARVGIANVAHNFYYAGAFRAIWPDWGDDIAWLMYASHDVLVYWANYIWLTADPSDMKAMDLANALWSAAVWISWIDPAWCQAVSRPGFGECSPNDTVVPDWAQVYPGAALIYVPAEGPTHTQETAWSDDLIYDALTNFAHVPPRGTGGGTGKSVNLQAANGQFVVAEGGGWGAVNANRDNAGPWETFALVDLNGGTLRDGDPVAFQTTNGSYLQAVSGGGGAIQAIGGGIGAWETFTIVDLDHPGGTVQSWDAVALRSCNGYFVVAESGGGDVVNVNRMAIGAWETFRLVVQ
jgi:pimeloyl-ACP methyl ester carboxylesterase